MRLCLCPAHTQARCCATTPHQLAAIVDCSPGPLPAAQDAWLRGRLLADWANQITSSAHQGSAAPPTSHLPPADICIPQRCKPLHYSCMVALQWGSPNLLSAHGRRVAHNSVHLQFPLVCTPSLYVGVHAGRHLHPCGWQASPCRWGEPQRRSLHVYARQGYTPARVVCELGGWNAGKGACAVVLRGGGAAGKWPHDPPRRWPPRTACALTASHTGLEANAQRLSRRHC